MIESAANLDRLAATLKAQLADLHTSTNRNDPRQRELEKLLTLIIGKVARAAEAAANIIRLTTECARLQTEIADSVGELDKFLAAPATVVPEGMRLQ